MNKWRKSMGMARRANFGMVVAVVGVSFLIGLVEWLFR